MSHVPYLDWVLALGVACLGCSHKHSIVERLESPTPVSSVSASGLLLSDGRFLGWGVSDPIPVSLTAVIALTEHGIEVGTDGRTVGLVEVWHWCGNDPIDKHLARVDIALALEFFGGRAIPGVEQPLDFTKADALFTEHGWMVESWRAFERWRGADPGRIYTNSAASR